MVSIREWLASRVQSRETSLTHIPENYWPLVAKFTQERYTAPMQTNSPLTWRKRDFSDRTITALSKYIQQELTPDDEEDMDNSASILPLNVIEDVVKRLATRVNYGIESSLAKTPAALCVWRWELKQEYLSFLPKVSREKVDARLANRIQVRQ